MATGRKKYYDHNYFDRLDEDPFISIQRSLLAEDTDTEEHDEMHFNLSSIQNYAESFIYEYQESTLFLDNQTINEGEWNCNVSEEMLEDLEHMTSSLDLYIEAGCTHSEHEEHIPDGVYVVLYCGFVLLVGCFLKFTQHRFHVPVPYTVLLLLVGAILELIEVADPDLFGHLNLGMSQVRTIDPHMVLSLFIPGLIFESAFNTNYHIFLKEAQQAAMLAGPGVLVNALLIGGVMHYFAHGISTFSTIDEDGYNWSWSFSIMFGSIVSATDPVAVVALLKDLGASKRLSTLIEAESLLNDGTAFVLFSVLQAYAASPADTSFASMLVTFVQLAFGGWALGMFGGIVAYYCLSNVYSDFEIEITFTLCTVYLFAYTGDFVFHVSGVLVIVFMGLWVSKNREAISPAVEESMHHFWEMVGFIANTLLFFITGQVIAFRIAEDAASIHWLTDTLILLMLYICCHIARGLAIWQMHPVLKNTGYGCTFEDSCVMIYGGLRGAIGLALALIVETKDEFAKIDRDRVLFHVCGIVVLTLVVNASTIKYLVEYLGLNKPPSDTAALFKSSIESLIHHIHQHVTDMKLDKHYNGANWQKVSSLQPRYDELYQSIFDDEYHDTNEEGVADDSILSIGDDDDEELIINMLAKLQRSDLEQEQRRAVEKRVIQVMKASYWAQFEKGLISADAVNILVESSEDAIDDHDLTKQRKNLKKWFRIPRYIKYMHQSKMKLIKRMSERLLFSNLGFAIEIATGFIYAGKAALDFCDSLSRKKSVENKHIESVREQLKNVTYWIKQTSADVVRVYPEVHAAIQTLHAAHALLHNQKHEIDHLLHTGYLDEAEHARVMAHCDQSLNSLFHTSYTKLLDGNHDDESILLESPLFSELSKTEKKLVLEKAIPSKWYKKGAFIMEMHKKSKRLFVITRGTVFVYEGRRKHIHTKERGDVIDVYSILQQNEHEFNFMVTTDQCHGYWLDLSLLTLLKDLNIDFWDTLWKYAATDVLRYYFADSILCSLTELDTIVFESPLSFFDHQVSHRSQIRVNRGVGVLLSGQAAHINDMNSQALAPAILPNDPDEAYVAIQDSVVLYLDFKRKDYHSQNTSHINPKLAKLMGMQASVMPESEDEDESQTESQTASELDLSLEEKEKEEDDYNEQEAQLLAGVLSKPNNNNRRSFHKAKSNIGTVNRYRSIQQLNSAAKKEFKLNLNEKQLPECISNSSIINDEWTLQECFETVKFVLSKHEGLYEHVKDFHVQHIQQEVIKQTTIRIDEVDEVDEVDEKEKEKENDDNGDVLLGPAQQIAQSQSLDPSIQLHKNRSLFARPSSLMLKKLSMHDESGSGNPKMDNKLKSSRYVLSHGGNQVGLKKRKKHHIIQAKGRVHPTYNQKKRNSNLPKMQSIHENQNKNKKHHPQDTEDIDGWTSVKDTNSNPAILSLNDEDEKNKTKENPIKQSLLKKKVSEKFKDFEENEMEQMIDTMFDDTGNKSTKL